MVQQFDHDAILYRSRADTLIEESEERLAVAVGIAFLFSLLIAIGLSRLILPPVRRAVAIATSIAEGRLDNKIAIKGNLETARLLAALSHMQSAISRNLEKIASDKSELQTANAQLTRTMQTLEKLASELNTHKQDLEKTIAERTADLARNNEQLVSEILQHRVTQANLEEAKRAAEAAALVKSEFLANTSHEIRTPMNAVIGMSDLLLRTELNNRQRHYLDAIKHAGNSLLALINNILDFSKAEAGHLKQKNVDLDVRLLVREIRSFLAQLASQKNIEFDSEVDENVPPFVYADGSRIRQILINLINNAIKFTEQGHVHLAVSFKKCSDTGGILKLVVADSGIGIVEKDHARIFNAFEQVDTSATRKIGGTGLGLAITRKFIELMDGTIALKSTVGVGSEFTVSIPVAISTAKPSDLSADAFALESVCVLIAAQDATEGEKLRSFVSRWGMAAQIVSSSAAALASLRQAGSEGKPFGLLICDLSQPANAGVDLIGEVRAEPAIADTPAILVGPLPEGLAMPASLRIAGFAKLGRPVNQSSLLDRVLELRSGHSTALRGATVKSHGPVHYDVDILLAEDNEVNQEVARENLESLGCRVDIANDGLEAFAAFQGKKYDLIFMDCQMPGCDGFEATRRIRVAERERKQLAKIPIIALTANAIDGDREKCLNAGMNDYVTKPFRLEDLVLCLDRWCAERRKSPVLSSPGNANAQPPSGTVGPSETKPAANTASPASARTHSSQDRSMFNEPYVANLRTNKPEFWQRLRTAFLTQAGAAREALPLALKSRDWATVKLVAHSFKSAAANVGAIGLSDICKKLEAASVAEDFGACTECSADFESAMAAVCQFMADEDQIGRAAGGNA